MYLYTARNLTHAPPSYFATAGLYIRLRGGFYSTDKLSFIFTAVKNVSLGQSLLPRSELKVLKEPRRMSVSLDRMCNPRRPEKSVSPHQSL